MHITTTSNERALRAFARNLRILAADRDGIGARPLALAPSRHTSARR